MGKDSLNMNYLKLNNERINLVGDMMVCDGQRLRFYISSENITITDIKEKFSNNEDFIVYDCVIHKEKDNKGNEITVESDEYIATIFSGFTRIVSINYDNELDMFEIVLISPMDIDARMADMETAMNYLLMGGEE